MKKCTKRHGKSSQKRIDLTIIVQSAVHWHEHNSSALAATDQCPCRWRSAWTQHRQKLTAAVCGRSEAEVNISVWKIFVALCG